jgi:hypothetical protein
VHPNAVCRTGVIDIQCQVESRACRGLTGGECEDRSTPGVDGSGVVRGSGGQGTIKEEHSLLGFRRLRIPRPAASA